MPGGDESGGDLFEDDEELEQAAQLLFEEENVDLARVMEEVEATPIESLPGFDLNAGKTWVYPNNMSHRDYQFNIVQSCLYDNTLVCLPTGLGKTFIAAVVMYNFYRWYPQGKIVFMAPTKPLVAQQIQACYKIMGIPQNDMVEMTGNVAVNKRGDSWLSKRVFFLTPQVMGNDLSRGLFPAKEVKLLVVDEAHKAQGDYAYCLVARELNRAGALTRIVALSATPGADVPSVKQVLQNLFISKIELRHEESEDIVPFTHHRNIDKIVVPLDEDLVNVRNKLLAVQEVYVKKLAAANAVRKGHNPSNYTKFAFLNSRNEWRQNPPGGLPNHVRGQVEADFATAMKLYHGMELLTTQGLRSFHNFFTKENPEDRGMHKRIINELGRLPAWRDLLEIIGERFAGDISNSRLNSSRPQLSQAPGSSQMRTKTSHPKMDKLLDVTKLHFQRAKEEGHETRVIIFSQFRDCVTELVACLDNERPGIRAMPFIGQAGAQGRKGLSQKEQLEVVKRFKQGGYNTLVATCVGEEGLDIGEVDLIVLYDVASSPIRLVQRMGRTGRKREGRVVVLVTQGREEQKYNQTMSNKNAIHKAIAEQNRLACALWQGAPRMVPAGLDPVCEKMSVVQKTWQGTSTSSRGGQRGQQQGANSLLSFVKRAKESKDDLFRRNCGFLTEAEEARWEREARWEGSTVRTVGNAGEYWAGKARCLEETEHRLDEWLDWSEGEVGRKLVGQSSVSATFARIMAKCRSGAFIRPQVQQQVQEVVEIEDEEQEMVVRHEKKSVKPRVIDSQSPNSKQGQSQGSRQGSILSYFTAGKIQKQFPTEIANHVEVIDLDGVDNELMLPIIHEEVTPDEAREEEVNPVKRGSVVLEPAEAELLDSLFDFDSGYDSPIKPTFGADLPDLDSLVLEPCSKEEIEDMMADARKRYLWPPEEVLEVQAYPMVEGDRVSSKSHKDNSMDMFALEQDMSSDMFLDDSAVKCENKAAEEEAVKLDPEIADFNLSSPEVEEVMEEQVGNDQGKEEMFPDVSQEDMFAASFDLGSPLVEEEIDNDEEKAPASPSSPLFDLGSPLLEDEEVRGQGEKTGAPPLSPLFDLGSPLLEDEADDRQLEEAAAGSPPHPVPLSATSTPLPGSSSTPTALDIDLTPVTSRFARHPFYQGTPMITPLTRRLMLLKASTPDPQAAKEQKRTTLKVLSPRRPTLAKSPQRQNQSSVSLVRTPPKLQFDKRESKEDASKVRDEIKDSEDMFGDDDSFDELISKEEEEKTSRHPPATSFYSASQLVGLLYPPGKSEEGNMEREKGEKEKRREADKVQRSLSGARKKLSSMFNESQSSKDHLKEQSNTEVKPVAKDIEEANAGNAEFTDCMENKSSTKLSGNVEEDFHLSSSDDFEEGEMNKQEDNCLTENVIEKNEIERPPVETQNCPICGKSVAEEEMNNHVDECLSVKAIEEISQAERPDQSSGFRDNLNPAYDLDTDVDDSPARRSMMRNGKGEEILSPVLVGKRKRSRVASSSSEDASISLLARPEAHTSKTTQMLASKRKRVVSSSSDDNSPLKKQTHTVQGDTLRDISNHMEDSSLITIQNGAKRKPRRNQFLDLEAELSGPEGSGDEVDEAEEGYEQSFVNDDTSSMCNKTSTAMYLRSVRSPEERPKRRLAPVTDDLFSQPVRAEELVEDYEEDSFVVGSQEDAEETRMDDTLDMLERRAALPPPPPPRRRRIAVRPNEDTIHQTQKQPEAQIDVVEEEQEESMSLLAGVVEEQEAEFVRPTVRLLKPEVDKESVNQLSMVVNSGEVGRNGEVISQLRHKHKLIVLVTRSEEATFLVGSQLAVIRMGEVEFSNGALKDKLVSRVATALALYPRLTVVVEFERLKAGEREKSGAKTKQAQLTCSQLAMEGVVLRWSSSQSETALLLAEMAKLETERGRGLPRGLKPTQTQEEMAKWLQVLPGVSLGAALVMAASFSSRREVVIASATTLEEKGIDAPLAASLADFFNHHFRPGLTDMAPL